MFPSFGVRTIAGLQSASPYGVQHWMSAGPAQKPAVEMWSAVAAHAAVSSQSPGTSSISHPTSGRVMPASDGSTDVLVVEAVDALLAPAEECAREVEAPLEEGGVLDVTLDATLDAPVLRLVLAPEEASVDALPSEQATTHASRGVARAGREAFATRGSYYGRPRRPMRPTFR